MGLASRERCSFLALPWLLHHCSAYGCGCQRSAALMSCPLTSLPTPRCGFHSPTQRTDRDRDRISCRSRQGAPLLRGHAARSTKPSAEWRLRVVDRAGYRRSSTLDRALPLPNVARLSAAAKPVDGIGARVAPARQRIPYWPGTHPDATNVGAPYWICALKRGHA